MRHSLEFQHNMVTKCVWLCLVIIKHQEAMFWGFRFDSTKLHRKKMENGGKNLQGLWMSRHRSREPYISFKHVLSQIYPLKLKVLVLYLANSFHQEHISNMFKPTKLIPLWIQVCTCAPPFYRYKSWGYRSPPQNNLYRMEVHRSFLTPFSL